MRPHLSKYWKIPPDANAAFVANMEDVLAVYELPYDADYPVVCMDESNKQLVGEVHAPIPMAPGHGEIVDHEYVRNGVANIFVAVEPLTGQRHVEITKGFTREHRADDFFRNRKFPCSSLLLLVAMGLLAGRNSLAAIQSYGQFLTQKRAPPSAGRPTAPAPSAPRRHLPPRPELLRALQPAL